MQNLFLDLAELLQKDERCVSLEGKLLKNKICELARSLDSELIKLILSHAKLKETFTRKVGGVIVFDGEKFTRFVYNKNFLPDSYTAYKNKIGLMADDEYLKTGKDVVLAWPHKDCVLEGGQTKDEEKRAEIFYNETLAPDDVDRLLDPKVLTDWKIIDAKGERELKKSDDLDWDKQNFIVKGNNLLALHSLKERFAGKVKLIYIDPPYNTEGDSFKYNDRFNHSTWLTFMKNRLEISQELLSPDGVILVHCDFIEEAYLKVLMDEVFDRSCYVNSISIRDSHPSGLKLSAKEKTIIKTKSTIVVYKKSEQLKINSIYQRRHAWDTHFNKFVEIESSKLQSTNLLDYVKKNKIVSLEDFKLDNLSLMNKEFKEFAMKNKDKIFQSTKEIPAKGKELSLKNKDKVVEYATGEYALNGRRLSPLSKSVCDVGFDGYSVEDFGKLLCDFWDDVDFNNSQNEGGVSLPSGKKPELLLARFITMFTHKGDLVLDFFAGSGTTCAVAHKMGRQYIGIEQMDYEKNNPEERVKNVINGDQSGISKAVGWKGGGSFVYCELMKWNEKWIRRIDAAKSAKELAKFRAELLDSPWISYRVNLKKVAANEKEFVALPLEDQRRTLKDTVDKNQLYVNLSEIEDTEYGVSEGDVGINEGFYKLSNLL